MEIKPLQEFESILASCTERYEWRDDFRLDAHLRPEMLIPAVKVLMSAGWLYLSAITGLDRPPAEDEAQEGQIELLYHFCNGPFILTLRTLVPYSHPVVTSVCSLIPYATLYERELIEMLGVEIQDTPSTDRLLLPDDWPDGVYPLRKSFKGL
jgi:Ni,Fe-hydrogenase III component G